MAQVPKISITKTDSDWKLNALRHTHASYAIAAGVALDSMLFEFGHVGGVETLRKHYLGRATKQEALEFYNLRPSKSTPQTTKK